MIDIHTHLAVYEFFPKYFIDGIVDSIFCNMNHEDQTEKNRAAIELVAQRILSDIDGQKQLKQQERAGIEKSVLLIIDFFYNEEDGQGLLENIMEAHNKIQKSNTDKFIVFTGIDPRRKQGMDLLEKSVDIHKFRGLKLYPPCGFELDDKELFSYYDYCQKKEIPVLAHTGPSLGNMKISNRLVESVERVVKNFPELKLILAHAGVRQFKDAISLGKYDNVYVDISGFQKEFNKKESIEYKFQQLVSKIPEKILLGTDWPLFNLNTSQSKWMSYLNDLKSINDTQKELLFKKNAETVLGL